MAAFLNGVTTLLVLCCFSFSCAGDFEDENIAFDISSPQSLKVDSVSFNTTKKRYLIYDVNPGEGFNLRRDVYMRIANLMEILRKKENWILVVPPWRRLYHWRSPSEQTGIPWRKFFDLKSLNRYTCYRIRGFRERNWKFWH